MSHMPQIILALNTTDGEEALRWVRRFSGRIPYFKVGLPLFVRYGPDWVREVQAYGEVFLDLKLHDIPDVVAMALEAVLPLAPRWVTVHASGGTKMLRKAAEVVAGTPTRLLAVTVLTSIGEAEGRQLFGKPPQETVLDLAQVAVEQGIHGIVASGHEAPLIRERLGDGVELVVPGFRLQAGPQDDQARVITPTDPRIRQIDYLVIGRALTHAPDPDRTLTQIQEALQKTASKA